MTDCVWLSPPAIGSVELFEGSPERGGHLIETDPHGGKRPTIDTGNMRAALRTRCGSTRCWWR